MKKLTLILYLASLLLLFIYSYTQIDLNLTLSSHPFYQTIQQQLIQIGYFNRPISTLIYLLILCSLFTCYFLFVRLSFQDKLSVHEILRLSLLTAVILLLSYPAFSHDIFNYIFDARILIHHHANPYLHTAQDFPQDLWVRFMRWTHRTYPYGPAWLPLSSLFYILGLGKFTLTLLSFKLLGALSYLVSIVSLQKITAKAFKTKTNSSFKSLALTLFAFNPLIIIESLVSSHLDITMAAVMLLAIYFILTRRNLSAWLCLGMSAGVKFVSSALVPFFYLFSSGRLSFIQFIRFSLYGTYLITFLVITQREILPWYFITPLALWTLIPQSKILRKIHFGLTIGLLLRYAPYLFYGEYTNWVKSLREYLTFITLGLFLLGHMISSRLLARR